jgi:DNA-binding response OmpR family regulator
MDMQMPVMDGFTATRTLRDHGLQTPILAFTANVMEQDRQRCVAAGCSGFLTKPINIDLLLSTIAEHLETTDSAAELPGSRTITLIRAAAGKDRIDDSLRQDPVAGSLLDEILEQLPGVAGIRGLDRQLVARNSEACRRASR